MKWLDKFIVNRAEQIVKNSQEAAIKKVQKETMKEVTLNAISMGQIHTGLQLKSEPNRLDAHPDLSFRMFRAENGYVMQVHQMDRKTERQTVNLHVITEDQDLGQAISHIITLESLKVG